MFIQLKESLVTRDNDNNTIIAQIGMEVQNEDRSLPDDTVILPLLFDPDDLWNEKTLEEIEEEYQKESEEIDKEFEQYFI